MILLFRYIKTAFRSRFSSRLGLLDEGEISFQVLPTDIDIFWHLNNGRYFSFMDLARFDHIVRNGAFSVLRKNKIYAVVASEMIRFKKSIGLFHKFQVTTKLIGWDDKFLYVVQHFKCNGKTHALALVKSRCLRASGGGVNPSEIMGWLNYHLPSPTLPDWVKDWQKADKDFHDEAMDTRHKC